MALCDASGTIEISAPPRAIYDVLTDLDAMSRLVDETAEMTWTTGEPARVGSTFRGTNRNGIRRWSTSCTVVAAEPGSRFVFDVDFGPMPVTRWSYAIDPTPDGCRVLESVTDRRPWVVRPFSGLATGHRDRATKNRQNIAATLERLKAHVEASGSQAQ